MFDIFEECLIFAVCNVKVGVIKLIILHSTIVKLAMNQVDEVRTRSGQRQSFAGNVEYASWLCKLHNSRKCIR